MPDVPPLNSVLIAARASACLALFICLGLSRHAVALLLLGGDGELTMAWLSLKHIGGQTGDVLGAFEQVSEILILLVAAAWL